MYIFCEKVVLATNEAASGPRIEMKLKLLIERPLKGKFTLWLFLRPGRPLKRVAAGPFGFIVK